MMQLRRLDTADSDFEPQLEQIIRTAALPDEAVAASVREIIARVGEQGDAAVLACTREFDGVDAGTTAQLRVSAQRLRDAVKEVPAELLDALQRAAERIRRYAEKQKLEDWRLHEDDGTTLGQRVTPLDSVGLYVPGGKAAYPSAVLMAAIPAAVAGVPRVAMVTPAPGGELSPQLLAAAELCGVREVWLIGGAQAVAALALGTQTITPVNKIVGPGNAYVAEAKRQLNGLVGIDLPAGPSEILIICDGTTEPAWVAADLCAQAEHDEQARAMLLCPDGDFITAVEQEIQRLLRDAPRAAIIERALAAQGLLLRVRDLDEAVAVANRIAPEHLELSVAEPAPLLAAVVNAGAVFVGKYSSEVVGDYCAGPNHVLPTGGAARFASSLGVYDFQKRSSLIHCSAEGAATLGAIASVLAEAEGLAAHADAARRRMHNGDDT